MHKCIILFSAFFLIIFCVKNPIDFSSESEFSIYFLKNSDLSYDEALRSDIKNLELQNDPWISNRDIDMYDYSTHFIYLKYNKKEYFDKYINEGGLYKNYVPKPFVITADKERIYLGSLLSYASSRMYAGPCIRDLDVKFYPSDVVPIDYSDIDTDIRNDDRIQDALIKLKIFHRGLRLKLSNVEVIKISHISTIQYSYVLYNDDEDNLYVLDPDKMSSEKFHYYTNGVVLWNESTHHLESIYKIVENLEWSPLWFSKINSKESMSRTVVLKGYPPIPSLKYECDFRFNSPNKVEKSERYLEDGRIWLGSIQSNRILLEVK
jgi:hypothetical protein